MGLPRLQSCCFVFDLKTGNIILGSLNAALSLVMMIVMIVVCVSIDSLEVPPDTTIDPMIADEQAALAGFYAMSVILAVLFAVKLVFDVIFVYAVVNGRSAVIKAYMVMWVVYFLLSLFTFSVNVTRYSAGAITTEIFHIGLNLYAILLSYSYYKLLNERETI